MQGIVPFKNLKKTFIYLPILGKLHEQIVTQPLFPTSLIELLAVGIGPHHPRELLV